MLAARVSRRFRQSGARPGLPTGAPDWLAPASPLTAEALRSPSLTTGHALNTESAKLARRDFRFDRRGACWRPVDRRPGKHCARCRLSDKRAISRCWTWAATIVLRAQVASLDGRHLSAASASSRVRASPANRTPRRGRRYDSYWANPIVRPATIRARPGRSLCRQCSRATSADRIAKAIVPVGDIA